MPSLRVTGGGGRGCAHPQAVSPLQVARDPSDYFTNLYTAFYRDEGACRALLENSRAVDWGQAFQIQGEPLQPYSIQHLPHGGQDRCPSPPMGQ
ncbi:adenosylhomocysteinase A-like [Platysternon megacephalum]|uniref:Adenosylhomocysteinase A-like n=1 Tax=Platysternon megacephalum TaxID=55544 RepID=A0A4D9DQK6_9SAUR|nr:adenosylhomocysteinase A-like [Platysternon megacephalum]